MRKYFLLIVTAFITLSCSQTGKYPAVRAMLKRIVPEKEKYFVIDSIAKEDGKDVFEIESLDGKIILRGTDPVVASAAFNYYLKHYCHCFLSRSGNNMNLPECLPNVTEKVRIVSPYKWRYHGEYSNFNYSMSWWGWEEWEREIDWLAMNGVNVSLAIFGMEAVWQNTLLKFNFTDKEIKEFLPGPAYTNWWILGNIEGWGGPVSQKWIDSRVELQKKIVARMREFGIQPVFEGFYSLVPAKMKEKYPDSPILKDDRWALTCMKIPCTLVPTDTLFEKMAVVYYDELQKLYGTTMFYGGDPFYERPVSKDIDLTASAKAIQAAMQKAVPGSIWVLNSWWEYPTDALLAGVDSSHTLILDVFSEGRPSWPRRDFFKKIPWTWNMLQNFGNKTGMYGRMEMVCSDPFRAARSEKGKTMVGIGAMPEGTDCNPVMWDILYDVSWMNRPPDLTQWTNEYPLYRYGTDNEKTKQAWNILRKTVYRGPLNLAGAKDAIVCARPSLDGDTAWCCQKIVYYYDTIDFQKAWKLMIDCSAELKDVDAFQYDLVDITRQALCDQSQDIHRQMREAYVRKDIPLFKEKSNAFLQLIDDLDRLLATRKEFLLGRWLEGAKTWATNEEEKKLFERNARLLITIWGCSDYLHEYAMKHWSGLMKDFYYKRWELFFNMLTDRLNGKQVEDIAFFSWEKSWTDKTDVFPDTPHGNSIEICNELFKKYANKKAFEPYIDPDTCKEHPKLTIGFLKNTLAYYDIGNYVIHDWEITECKIVKEDYTKENATVLFFLKTKKGWSGKLEINYEWNIYEWGLVSIKNIDFKNVMNNNKIDEKYRP